MFTNRGDMILTDEYASAVECAAPMGVRAVGIKMDDEGMLPADMEHILSTWDVAARGAPKPKLLYTVPSGQNPTGATMGHQRRKDIYAICQKHDIYIFEDEPVMSLQNSLTPISADIRPSTISSKCSPTPASLHPLLPHHPRTRNFSPVSFPHYCQWTSMDA